jgi:DNA-binding GntR family transcriptional regulator
MAIPGSQTISKTSGKAHGNSEVTDTVLQNVLGMSMSEALDYSSLENVSKATLTRISMNSLPGVLPDFEAPGVSKDLLIASWLKKWITDSLAKGSLTEQHILPRKADIANHLKVSVGTVQNAIRYIEDEGFVESKQRIGTLIRNVKNSGHRMRKQTSKRDQAVLAIKHYIVNKDFQSGDLLPSARTIAQAIQSAPNTTRLALEFLSGNGILKSLGNRGNKANWSLQVVPEIEASIKEIEVTSETLIDQLERDLKQLIADRYGVQDRLPSHLELSAHFKISIKTVHDAMRRLAKQGIIHSKRGRYGSFVLRKPDTSKLLPLAGSIFVPAEQARFYNYERVEGELKILILESYPAGSKLPPMGELATQLHVSSNTVRKALQKLSAENLVRFSRGRYGGTYVVRQPKRDEVQAIVQQQEKPKDDNQEEKNFTWLSINPGNVKPAE